jgi:sn-glycerol 3-phosphate transport system permease protein
VATLVGSLFDAARQPARFTGADNYAVMLDDPVFWRSVSNNLWFAVGTIGLDRARHRHGAVGQRPAGRAGLAHRLLHADNSADDRRRQHLAVLLHATVRPAGADPRRIWTSGGQLARLARYRAVRRHGRRDLEGGRLLQIFYLAALQQIPPSLAEAAALEGASRHYYLRRVVLPLLMPTTMFVLINAVINAFRLVDHIIVMTRGGPDNVTSLLLFYIYEVGFKFWDTSYAAALTMVLVVWGVALAQYLFLERRTHYQ